MIEDLTTGTLVPSSTGLSDILSSYPEFHTHDIPYYDVYVWDTLYDSSDITPAQWITLANNIYDNYNNYDGFVILHGTDTLSYTASALSFMCQYLTKPIILTGSMIPLSKPASDGKRNLLISLLSCCIQPTVNEVCVYFDNVLLRGNRSHKYSPSSIDAFKSLNCRPLAKFGTSIQLNTDLLLRNDPLIQKPFSVYTQLYDIGNIVVVTYTPGFNANLLKPLFDQSTQDKPIALVLSLYGAGNAPTLNKILIDVLKYGINNKDVEIVVCSQCDTGSVDMLQYACGYIMHSLGSINALDMTLECIVTKLIVLMGKGFRKNELKKMMETDICGELTYQHNKQFGVSTGNSKR